MVETLTLLLCFMTFFPAMFMSYSSLSVDWTFTPEDGEEGYDISPIIFGYMFILTGLSLFVGAVVIVGSV